MLDTQEIERLVAVALAEDVGDGDVSAALVPAEAIGRARVIAREPGVLCGSAFAGAVFARLDARVELAWHREDGDRIHAGDTLLTLRGPARALLTGERTVLNFLQLLSGTATAAAEASERVRDLPVRILDTRKTLPGLRLAQKYAVRCGGGHNHRVGLFDAYLVKENHIAACGGIGAAVARARSHRPDLPVEVEVETFAELDEALEAGADVIMLDNFDLEATRAAVTRVAGRARLEASGGLEPAQLRAVAETGVDYVSMGALTKHVRALDLSMRLELDGTPERDDPSTVNRDRENDRP